jgi:4-hydroxy-tetrahydrodipicolinate synthase
MTSGVGRLIIRVVYSQLQEYSLSMSSSDLASRLRGVIPPMITPLTADRRYDAASGQRLSEYFLAAGVHGLFPLGTSGEGPYLTEADQLAAVKMAVKVASGKVPVLAGLLAPGTDQACLLAKKMQDLGADAVVVAPPYYYPATQSQILDHFRVIRESVTIPLVAYDIPVTTHHRMQLETVLTLAQAGTVIGIKDSTGDYGTFRRLLLKAPSTFRILTGSEQFFDSVLGAGAHGVVPGLSNVAPQGFVALYNAFVAGNSKQVAEIQAQITRLLEVFHKVDGSVEISRAIAVMKQALHFQGVIATTTTTRPFVPLSAADVDRTRRIMQETGFLN